MFLVHVGGPLGSGTGVSISIAVRIRCAPFADEYRVSGTQRLFDPAAESSLGMGRCIEVQNIGDVGGIYRVGSTVLWFLRPGRRTYENQVLRVVADERADCVGVAFDCAPVATIPVNRLVVDFVDDVRHVFVLFGNCFEECLCESRFHVGAVTMPVDNDVDIAFDGRGDHVVYQAEIVVR